LCHSATVKNNKTKQSKRDS